MVAMVAVEICMINNERQWERHLGVTFLGYSQMGLAHKIFNVLWTVYLETGPDAHALRYRLSLVAGFTTDRSTERDFNHCRDVLPEFLEWVGCDLVCERVTFLFPDSCWDPGWQHGLDDIARMVYNVLPFWPSWLAKLQEGVTSCRVGACRRHCAAIPFGSGFWCRGVCKEA